MEQQRASTPLMQQYFAVKNQYPDTLILFQVGDFYELFYDDAQKAAACLAITLTSRGKNQNDPIPLCGVPVHARDHYVAKLVRAGFRVALCDQLEQAVPGKVVARGVTQVLTPGTLVESNLLDAQSASYVVSLFSELGMTAIVACELLTGTLTITTILEHDERAIDLELSRFLPDEVLVAESVAGKKILSLVKKLGFFAVALPERPNAEVNVAEWRAKYAPSAVAERLSNSPQVIAALGLLFGYLEHNRQLMIEQLQNVTWYQSEDYVIIDPMTQRNLELVANLQDGSRKNTLLELIDSAKTAMGSRCIKKWLLRPLINCERIEARLDVLTLFSEKLSLAQMIERMLESIGDFERVVGRIALNRAQQQDYQQLLRSLRLFPELAMLLADIMQKLSIATGGVFSDFSQLAAFLNAALEDDIERGTIIRLGFNEALDQMRTLIADDASIICQLEQREQSATGIASLKIRYNQIQGYYIEITKANFDLVPADYIRLQTLVGKERFTTPELKQLEARINAARAEVAELESQLYDQVKTEVRRYLFELRKTAQFLAQLDALFGLWKTGYERGYVRPIFTDTNQILIEGGRHPVIEAVQTATRFVPNDTLLSQDASVWVITGPNMGGKSTFLRQTALISIMAQCGSFVPAQRVELSIRDRIFTRIGASDNVAGGKSTFLVEMEETARICSQATERSLVVLDEVGRGTSTFDGLAIAQAVLEYIAHDVRALCLFATHYHELTQLAQHEPRVRNYCADTLRNADHVIFTYKIRPGVASGSFGIDVAKIAGLPEKVIDRARQLLECYKINH